jgi:hypothetical protein
MKSSQIFLTAILLFSLASGLQSCYYDTEEELYPADPNAVCDTTNVTYSAAVKPILQQNCASCHSGGISASGGVDMEDFNQVQTVALNGKLVGTISHASGFKPMPQGGNKLPDCAIAKIKKWADSGAPNN